MVLWAVEKRQVKSLICHNLAGHNFTLWCCRNMSCQEDRSCSRSSEIFGWYLHEVHLRPHSRLLHVGYELTERSCWARAYLCRRLSNGRCWREGASGGGLVFTLSSFSVKPVHNQGKGGFQPWERRRLTWHHKEAGSTAQGEKHHPDGGSPEGIKAVAGCPQWAKQRFHTYMQVQWLRSTKRPMIYTRTHTHTHFDMNKCY